MKKISINTSNFGYPMPIVLIGTEVQEKPNFMTAAWMTHVNLEPSMLAVCLSRDHFTSGGIRENQTFSVNFPDTSLAIKTDFCGMNSGKETYKSTLFTVFHGKLKNVPLIDECPLCVGCTVSNINSVAG
ncbi:MAG: flavin reductase family protein, partial [Atribacterota bacterium]